MTDLDNGMTPQQYDDIIERLSTIDDPELGVNIVDLGLIYDMQLNGKKLGLLMTLTYAGCPLQEMISDEVHDSLLGTGLEANIMWTFSPPWSMERLTDEGRDQLRALGANVDSVHESHTQNLW